MLYIILIFSILLNIIFITISTQHYYKRFFNRFKNSLAKKYNLGQDKVEKIILLQSLRMAKIDKGFMPVHDTSHFIAELRRIKNYRRLRRHIIYNYPKAFLFAGLTSFALENNSIKLMDEVIRYFNNYLNKDGSPSFLFDKVDQAPFGIAAINIYNFYNIEKYKNMADYIFNKLNEWVDNNSELIPYRNNNKETYFNDTIGMVCPFLVRYGVTFNNSIAIEIAKKQLQYYIKYGIDNTTFLPTHCINTRLKIKLGPTNWGRGIGWYLIGLADYYFYTKDQIFIDETNKLIETLNKLQLKEGLWSQFPGTSKTFDSSATLMYLYAINTIEPGTINKEIILKKLNKYIINGIIESTSGDTYGINRYSNTFGPSELTQGFLLMLLSKTE